MGPPVRERRLLRPKSLRGLRQMPGLVDEQSSRKAIVSSMAEQMQILNDLLREAGPNEVHLVLGATTGLQQMRDALQGFDPVGVDRLLFTRLDETARFGAACTMAVESGVPMSYITNSRMVPGDLHPARPALLSTALFHRSLNGLLK